MVPTVQSAEMTALKALEELETRTRNIEKRHLNLWKRIKRRWLKKEIVVAWNISSWVTIGQLVIGKKAWLWVIAKAPWVGTTAKAIGGWVLAALAAIGTVLTP